MTLDAHEFIRRFLIHVLPTGFDCIRHYGLLGSGMKADNLVLARKLLDVAPPAPEPEPEDIAAEPPTPLKPCPCCGSAMRIVEVFKPGEPARHRPAAMRPGNLFRRCYPNLSRWSSTGRDNARSSRHPAGRGSASDPCYPATRAPSLPRRGSAITPPATSPAAASAMAVSKSP